MPWYLRKLMAHAGYLDQADDGSGLGGGGGSGAPDGGGGGAPDGGGGGAPDGGGGGAPDGGGGGGEKPTDAEAKLIKEVMDKKNKLKAQEQELRAVREQLKKFEGIDLEAVQAMLAEKKAAEEKKLADKGEWDRLRAQMVEENSRVVNEYKEKLTTSEQAVAKLNGVIAELTVGNSFTGSQFIRDELVIPVSKVRVLYGSHFEYQDGAVVAYDKPAGASERTMLVDGNGEPLGFEAALKKIVDTDPDREQLLKSKIKPGASSNTKPSGKAPQQKLEQQSGIDRIAAALSGGVLAKK